MVSMALNMCQNDCKTISQNHIPEFLNHYPGHMLKTSELSGLLLQFLFPYFACYFGDTNSFYDMMYKHVMSFHVLSKHDHDLNFLLEYIQTMLESLQ